MRAPHLALASAFALAAPLAVGADPAPLASPKETPPPSEATPSTTEPFIDVYGRLRATPDRVLLEFGSPKTRIDLRAAGGDATTAKPFGPPQPQPHEIQSYFNIDAQSASFVLRRSPPPTEGGTGSGR